MSRRVSYPFPELLTKASWDIVNTDTEQAFIGHTYSGSHIMQVPLGPGASPRFIRAHELTHVAISPKSDDEIPIDIQRLVFHMVEEARVNWVVRHCVGLPETNPANNDKPWLLTADLAKQSDTELSLKVFGTYGRWEQTHFEVELLDRDEALHTQTLKLLSYLHEGCDTESYPTLSRAYEVCRILQEAFGQRLKPSAGSTNAQDPLNIFDTQNASGTADTPGEALEQAIQAKLNPDAPAPKPKPKAPTPLTQKQQLIKDILGNSATPHPSIGKPGPEPIESPPPELPPFTPIVLTSPERRPGQSPSRPSTNELWATPKIKEYPMSLRSLDPKLGRRRTTYSDEGIVPQAWHRSCTDGAIFTRRTRGKAMSILIDASGSMDLSFEQISNFLAKAPNSLMATYCARLVDAGTDMDSRDHYSYHLSIISKRGKRCNKKVLAEVPRDGGNEVDGLALRWLANQPKPRIWISDGCVVPAIPNYSNYMSIASQDCLEVCLDAGIKQFLDFDSFLSALGTKDFDNWSYKLPYLELKNYYESGCPIKRMPEEIRTEGYKLP